MFCFVSAFCCCCVFVLFILTSILQIRSVNFLSFVSKIYQDPQWRPTRIVNNDFLICLWSVILILAVEVFFFHRNSYTHWIELLNGGSDLCWLFVNIVQSKLAERLERHHSRLILRRFAIVAAAVEHLWRISVER